ncbi:hypothetical protein PAECIP111893_02769 [Paenibacillus plantiphilus]|uniref:Uncharacterized protein n=1 Tax=Paenibacillus plantiphilus TaxID=2905650 RepID=A0ABM9C9D5_9BACL|nr:hypothetical protein [Paenibacillus plantiphilus]CAH1207744.1 hypothetical protein PAECIP111893_02769 [Paenibacillus plantiphilus]
MTNMVFVGDCEKVDLMLATALLLQAHQGESSAAVISDVQRHYRYFQEEVSGIAIRADQDAVGSEQYVLYDWHSLALPEIKMDKLFAVTTYDRSSLDMAGEIIRKHQVDGLIVLESDCAISPKYIRSLLPVKRWYSYYDYPWRRINWVFDGRVGLRRIEKDFAQTIGDLVQDVADISENELKKLWMYAKKRGA